MAQIDLLAVIEILIDPLVQVRNPCLTRLGKTLFGDVVVSQ
jgi:hypothetical protein